MGEMPEYECHKTARAIKIESVKPDTDGGAVLTSSELGFARFRVGPEYVTKHNPQAGGYYVRYADGYASFSTAAAFETGYTLVK